MQTSTNMTENEQKLHLIYEMISNAKQEINENGFIFLMWGWLVFLSSMVHFIGLQLGYPQAAIVWMLMIAGGIFTGIYYSRQSKKEKVKSYLDSFLTYLWIAFGAALFIVLFFQMRLGLSTFPMVMLIYGIGTFVTGGAIKFKPLIIGGIACWLLSAAAFFVNFEIQLLLLAASVMVSYIIPGYLLRRKFNGSVSRA
ncbi:MAG: hypothetical protein ACXWDO_03465 [Bacteroidia bacterium]